MWTCAQWLLYALPPLRAVYCVCRVLFSLFYTMPHQGGDLRVIRALYRHMLLAARRVERTVTKERTRSALRHLASSYPALSQHFKTLDLESDCPVPSQVVRDFFRGASSGAIEARIDDGFDVLRKLQPLMERLHLHAQLNNYVLSSDGIEEGALLLAEQDRRVVDRQAFRRQIDEIAGRIRALRSQAKAADHVFSSDHPLDYL